MATHNRPHLPHLPEETETLGEPRLVFPVTLPEMWLEEPPLVALVKLFRPPVISPPKAVKLIEVEALL